MHVRRHARSAPRWPTSAPRSPRWGAAGGVAPAIDSEFALVDFERGRDLGLGLPTIRACFKRAVDEVHDDRPFSTQRFRTDGRTIFLEITHDVREGELIDLKRRQHVFHRVVAPSLRDLEFDADVAARWFPLGISRKAVVINPARAFGRPNVREGTVPTEILFDAVRTEGSPEKVARLYEVPLPAVRAAVMFQQQLAA